MRPKTRRGKPPPRKRSTVLRVLLFSLLGAGIVTLATIGLLFVRLQYGGLSLDAIRPAIEQALQDDLDGARVAIDSAELRLENGTLAIHLRQSVIRDAQGRTLAQVGQARAALSWSALRRARLAISSVDLVAPRVMLATASSGALTMSFEAPAPAPSRNSVAAPSVQQVPVTPAMVDADNAFDIVKLFTDLSARARRRETASGYLRQIGVRDAVVIVASGTHRTVWNVPDARVDLSHKREASSAQATATISTLTGPLTVTALTNEAAASDQLSLDLKLDGFNPRGLARLVPGLGAIETIDLPLAGKASFTLSTDGVVQSATVEAGAPQGAARFGLLGRKPVDLGTTKLAFKYDGARRAIDIGEFSFGWAGNRISLAGQIVDAQANGWTYALRSTGGLFAAPRASGRGAPIDQARANGRFLPATGKFTLEDFALKAARAEITAKGDVTWNKGVPSGQIDGRLSPMTIDALVALWPSLVAPGVRDWVASHVTKGQLAGGLFKAAIEGRGGDTDARLSLTLEASNVQVHLTDGLPPLEIPRGLLRAEGQTIEITAPEFIVTASEGRKISFKTARFTAVETAVGDQPTAEIAFRLNGSLAAAADIADRDALKLLRGNGIAIAGIDGKLDGIYKAVFPLADNVQMSEVRSEGRLRVSDLKARQAVGPHDISGGTIDVDIGDKVVDVKGNVLVKGVNGRFGWQYQLNQLMAQQPPARITATLDNADRVALGIDVADIVQGETPLEVLVSFAEGGQIQPRVRVDLTKAELTFEPISWRKAPGRVAAFQFDPVKGPGTGAAQRLELQNMKLTGDDIALDGWMAIGPDNKPREFSLPDFTLNVVSRLNVQGKRRPDNVWEINAKGPTFDGREIFRSMFNVGQPAAVARKDKPGLDLTADIDTVIGFSDTTLKAVKLKLSQRADKLTELDLKSMLTTGKPFVALVRQQPNVGRQLLAEGKDAGQVFKLVGFYPSAVGGEMQLEVNLDAKGANEKSGTLWAQNFAVLGDSIVGDLYQNADSQPASGQGPKQPRTHAHAQRVQRQQFDFDSLHIPFAVGSGQMVMNKAVIRGPVIGATFRGEIDFKVQRVNLGGTYVPLSGLNQALGSILGPLTGGPQGEGLFGITFQVVGPLANPQVIANPLSLLGPGIFREIFQMTPETFRVTPRADVPAPAPKGRTRTPTAVDPAKSSSAPAITGPSGSAAPATSAPRVPGEVVPDWSSNVKPAPR